MAKPFAEVINLNLARFTPENARLYLIDRAKTGIAEFLARQQAPPSYTLEVDGHPASSEDEVQPWGKITYRFSRMREACAFAMDEARRLSPVASGRYRDRWFFLYNNTRIGLEAIPRSGKIILTNDEPYARKINVGARGFERYVPPGIVEKVKQSVQRRYGAVVALNLEYITLSGGYILQKGQYRIHKGRRYGTVRPDMKPQTPITYPALVISPKIYIG